MRLAEMMSERGLGAEPFGWLRGSIKGCQNAEGNSPESHRPVAGRISMLFWTKRLVTIGPFAAWPPQVE